MATVKISELPRAQDIGAADEVLVVQDGKTCKAKASALRAYLTGGFELQNLSVTPTETQQTFGPANGVCYESVAVSPILTETKSITVSFWAQTVTPTQGKYLTKVDVDSAVKPWITNDTAITPTGTYATATYYDVDYGVRVGYCSNGDILISMKGGTTTSYEFLQFTLASAPSYVTLTAFDMGSHSSTAGKPGVIYACVLSGIQWPMRMSIDMSTYNATYDYTTCAITLTPQGIYG